MAAASAPARTYLDFEKPIAELEAKIDELSGLEASAGLDAQIDAMRGRANELRREAYRDLDPWRKTQVARHPERPHFIDYRAGLIEDWVELRGDRAFGDDQAILGGIGRFRGRSVMVIGHEKGADTAGRIRHNFGMAKPEGYRKARRLMELADQFGLPAISFVDTAGAFPGIEAEERGQAEAIARSTEACLALGAPNVALVIGEGGSGGAVAIATCNHVLMLEHSIYTVASPEASAAILWKSSSRAEDAATNMKITAQDLLRFGIIDGVIPEPSGGAHRDPQAAIRAAGDAVATSLAAFGEMSPDAVREARAAKFLGIGRRA